MDPMVVTDGPGIPATLGPYARAHAAGELLFVSGLTGVEPVTGQLVQGGAAAQAGQVLRNLRSVLACAGLDFAAVAKVNVYLTDMNDFDEVNAAFAAAFGEARPARTTVGVAALPRGAVVEMELVARRKPLAGSTTADEAYRAASAWLPR